jgi:hypothetical protein
MGNDVTLSRSGKVDQFFASLCIVNHSSHRHRQFNSLTIVPGPLAALAMPPALCRMLRIKAKVQQRIVMIAGHHFDVTAFTAIAAAGAATGHKLLAPERQTAVATVAGFNGNNNFINKHLATSIF